MALSLGLALLFTPAFTTGLNPLPPHLYSHGSAIMSTLQQVAGAAGTALLVSIYAVVSAGAGIVAGMHAAFLTAAVIAVAAVVLSAMMRKTAGADTRARPPTSPAHPSANGQLAPQNRGRGACRWRLAWHWVAAGVVCPRCFSRRRSRSARRSAGPGPC